MEMQSSHLDENDLGDGIGLIWETACISGISLAMLVVAYKNLSLNLIKPHCTPPIERRKLISTDFSKKDFSLCILNFIFKGFLKQELFFKVRMFLLITVLKKGLPHSGLNVKV